MVSLDIRGRALRALHAAVLFGVAFSVSAGEARQLRLSQGRKASAIVVVDSSATEVEQTAAADLASILNQITGGDFGPVNEGVAGKAIIAVGPGAARKLMPDLDLSLASLGHEGIVIHADESQLLLSGADGARRGTFYAVYTFLTDTVGCRWWTPEATTLPLHETLDVPAMSRREKPRFEYRESYISHTVEGPWAARNRLNGHFYGIPDRCGGHTVYRGYEGGWGFVHTFDILVPPTEFFALHPEWFSEIGGRRVGPPERSQWCLTNPELLELVKTRVYDLLASSPPDSIIEVSQNDWGNRCECAACAALEKEEGSPAGPLLRFVNAVADHIGTDFPDAVISTLAYQYTRKPPLLTRPRPNVCIRLCSIECSFLQPLEHEVNRAFADDIRRWSELTDRLYVWDYITNFSVPLQPHPNLRVLAPNLRFFAQNGVKGVFEEGGHYTLGAAFSEIRAWVLGRLLWDPSLDGDALVREFVAGYYGPAAPQVQAYIDLLHDAADATGSYMTCFDRKGDFLTLDVLQRADTLLSQAEAAVADQPALKKRVELVHASVWYGIISRWPWLEWEQRGKEGAGWFARDWTDYCADTVRVAREHGVAEEHITRWDKPDETREATVPDLVKALPTSDWLDLQQGLFTLYERGTWADIVADPVASDGMAARMPATHLQWAVQSSVPPLPGVFSNDWDVYVGVRIERQTRDAVDGPAFSAGVYDVRNGRALGAIDVSLAAVAGADTYSLYLIEGASVVPDAYIWVAPAANPDVVKAVWVDRILLVKKAAPVTAP